MAKKMLIDARHPEEVRVAVIDDGKLVEMDVDTSTKKQNKGNIYLAKVVRVEPSLQAAFVDYGGHRHGFLPFSGIHPDYYQIPVADKEALRELLEVENESADEIEEVSSQETEVETVSAPATDDFKIPKMSFFKKYKIQEVIHHGQIMLVQVIKEERGNKGAALTTYLSLAGRYSVLMPNNGKGAGVSRKITNIKARKTLKDIVSKLPVPKGMSVIIRTAGQDKKRTEIKRDYDYLMKTWARIRESTLESIAPKLIHEEGNIIKRSLRDVYTADIEEILVEGAHTFKGVKDFVKLLLPSQAKKVVQYQGQFPLFSQYQIEQQIEILYSNTVSLKSGGYIVIDQTEALVSVDVNSGRAIKERDLEETALRTNLEACEEIARQLRLRDLAGLVVIDFIDMSEPKNNAHVERSLKEALKQDRARIQVGKISGFGLMEMSRQRLHSSVLESSYVICSCCAGKGRLRTVESCAIRIIHFLEQSASEIQNKKVNIYVPDKIALYLLNNTRSSLFELEEKYNAVIRIFIDPSLELITDYRIEKQERTDLVVEQENAIKTTIKKIFQKKKPVEKKKAVSEESSLKEKSEKEEAKKEKQEVETPKKEKNKEEHKGEKNKKNKNRPRNSSKEENRKNKNIEKFKVIEQTNLADFEIQHKNESTQDPVEKKTGWWNKILP